MSDLIVTPTTEPVNGLSKLTQKMIDLVIACNKLLTFFSDKALPAYRRELLACNGDMHAEIALTERVLDAMPLDDIVRYLVAQGVLPQGTIIDPDTSKIWTLFYYSGRFGDEDGIKYNTVAQFTSQRELVLHLAGLVPGGVA